MWPRGQIQPSNLEGFACACAHACAEARQQRAALGPGSISSCACTTAASHHPPSYTLTPASWFSQHSSNKKGLFLHPCSWELHPWHCHFPQPPTPWLWHRYNLHLVGSCTRIRNLQPASELLSLLAPSASQQCQHSFQLVGNCARDWQLLAVPVFWFMVCKKLPATALSHMVET